MFTFINVSEHCRCTPDKSQCCISCSLEKGDRFKSGCLVHTQKSDNVTLELSLWISETPGTLEFVKADVRAKAFTLQISMDSQSASQICTCVWMHAQLRLRGNPVSRAVNP